jgi:hypothetical protein
MGSQSNVIALFVIAAFVLFITSRGELPVYMGFLLGGPSAKDQAVAGVKISAGTVAEALALL